MRIEHKPLIQWFDDQLKGLEQDADRIGYIIEEDGAYMELCEQVTAIEWEDKDPTTMDWIAMSYMVGIIRGRINQKQAMG